MLGYKIYLLSLLCIILFYSKKRENYTSENRNKIKIVGNKIYKTHNNQKTYYKIKKLYDETLHKFDFVPIMEFNDKKLEIIEDYIKNKLTKKNKPKDYENQLRNIYNTFRKNNLYHNDLAYKDHIRVKNNKILVIDFDSMGHNKSSFSIKRKSNNINYIISKYT
jgi:thiamine kinase-like enzyme|tara:strand:- start:1091 stop:1582 length:492 start_codon:yes stop_codon:yes gene_type:complete